MCSTRTGSPRENQRRVELETRSLDPTEGETVRELVAEHVLLTRSARGAAVLGDWPATRKRFVCVDPTRVR